MQEPRDQDGEFWRDLLVKLLSWGTGAFLLVAGWGISAGHKLRYEAEDDLRAEMLTAATLLVGLLWIGVSTAVCRQIPVATREVSLQVSHTVTWTASVTLITLVISVVIGMT